MADTLFSFWQVFITTALKHSSRTMVFSISKACTETTEEVFFVDFDYGGPYWDKNLGAAKKSYEQFDPSNFVDKWTTPMLIFQGGKDYRVSDGQGFEAFQALQLRGIKSRLVYLPTENHWVLTAQNSQVWQKEFFRWLDETLLK